MESFATVLYEAVLVAFGKILAKYDGFTQGVIMRDIGKEIIDYLNAHGYEFKETGSLEDIHTLVDLFVKNGFAESLVVRPADPGKNYIWKNLYGRPAYKELYDLTLNPFLACPLNLCMYYVAGKYGKRMVMHRKDFISDSITEAQYELVDDDVPEGSLNELVLPSARLFEIADEKQKLYRHQSITDPLTGLRNRRYLLEEGERLYKQAARGRKPIAILLLDIDYFKLVNDRFGHGTGDTILRLIADICRRCLRDTDLVGRYGGEEFVVILPNSKLPAALEIAERLRSEVENTTFQTEKSGDLALTISIGVNSCPAVGGSFESALDNADTAMYQAKQYGRNKIAVYDPCPQAHTI
jgi:diguanylate cyclase (GGDEF)-like protein